MSHGPAVPLYFYGGPPGPKGDGAPRPPGFAITDDPNLCTLPHVLRYRYKTCLLADQLGFLPAVSVASEVPKEEKLAAANPGDDTVGIIISLVGRTGRRATRRDLRDPVRV